MQEKRYLHEFYILLLVYIRMINHIWWTPRPKIVHIEKGQSVDIIKRHIKLQWMLDRSVTISKYKIFNRKTWAESRLQIGFWRYEILNKQKIYLHTNYYIFQSLSEVHFHYKRVVVLGSPIFFYRFSGTHHKGLDFCFSIIKKETLTQRPTQTFWRDHKLYFYTIK